MYVKKGSFWLIITVYSKYLYQITFELISPAVSSIIYIGIIIIDYWSIPHHLVYTYTDL